MFLRAPSSWSPVVVAAAAMVLLGALDLAGAYAAKEAVARRSVGFGAAGVLLFVTLFWVYCSSLQYAELAPVTLGWVVILQVGVVLLDRFKYGQTVPRGHWLAVVLILAAQAYLILVPTTPATADPPAAAAAADGAGDHPARRLAAVDVRDRSVVTPLPRQSTPPRHEAVGRHRTSVRHRT